MSFLFVWEELSLLLHHVEQMMILIGGAINHTTRILPY